MLRRSPAPDVRGYGMRLRLDSMGLPKVESKQNEPPVHNKVEDNRPDPKRGQKKQRGRWGSRDDDGYSSGNSSAALSVSSLISSDDDDADSAIIFHTINDAYYDSGLKLEIQYIVSYCGLCLRGLTSFIVVE